MCADHADLYGFQFLSLVFLHRHGSASTCSGWWMESRSRSPRKLSLPETKASTTTAASIVSQRHNRVTTAVSVKVRKPDGTVETTRTESDGSQQGLTTRCTRCSTCALCHVCSTIFHVFHLSTANQETGWNMISLQSTSICSVLFRSVHDTTSLLKWPMSDISGICRAAGMIGGGFDGFGFGSGSSLGTESWGLNLYQKLYPSFPLFPTHSRSRQRFGLGWFGPQSATGRETIISDCDTQKDHCNRHAKNAKVKIWTVCGTPTVAPNSTCPPHKVCVGDSVYGTERTRISRLLRYQNMATKNKPEKSSTKMLVVQRLLVPEYCRSHDQRLKWTNHGVSKKNCW